MSAECLAGLREGRTFVTNAPLLGLEFGGQEPGGTIRRPSGSHTIDARVEVTKA